MTNSKNTPNNDQPEPLDPTHKLNEPVPFDASQFGDVSDLKFPEPKIIPAKSAAKETKLAETTDEATLFANVPKLDCSAQSFAVMSEQVRASVTHVLEKKWPAAYAHYRSLKYPVPGTEPTLEQRKAAYVFAFRAFLHLTYTKSFAEGQG